MNETDVRNLIEAIYKNRLANDSEACLALFDPQASFRIAGSSEASPIAAGVIGTAALRQALTELVATWVWRKQDIQSITIQGDRAAVHFALETLFTPTGHVVHTELLDLVTVRDNKVVSLVEFVDTAHVSQLVAKAQAAR